MENILHFNKTSYIETNNFPLFLAHACCYWGSMDKGVEVTPADLLYLFGARQLALIFYSSIGHVQRIFRSNALLFGPYSPAGQLLAINFY